LEAACKNPAASKRRITGSPLADFSNGLITAMGFPRSVNTTSSPVLTAFMAIENRWFASRSPSRM
jgi:hypothetical protein